MTTIAPVPIEFALWTKEDIGAYLKVAAKHVTERYTCLPDFPKRIELPISGGRKMHPRWKALDVIKWVEGYAG